MHLRNIHHYLFIRQMLKCHSFLETIRWKNSFGGSDFPERFVQIHTCGDLYRKWRDQKLYLKLPKGDLTFKVPFIDTSPNDSKKVTVLALHGAPGSWKEFIYLSSYLHNRGCRVIAPSFPDFYTYKPGVFRHSDVEKAEYVKDFLKSISVSNVDLLVCHSSATYPGLNLCLDQKPTIKSLALLNPGTFNVKEMSSTKAFSFMKNFVKAGENPILLKLMEIIGPFVLKKIIKIPIRFESVLEPLLSATAMAHGNIKQSKEKFKLVSEKLPIFYVFSENDPLICTKPSYDLAELFGASTSDIFIYNKEGQLEQEGIAKPRLKVLAIRQGSHYAFLKYPELINGELTNFLKDQKIL